MTELKRIGKIEGVVIPRLLMQCYREKVLAIIDFQQDETIKSLHLEHGNIVFARSNLKSDRFGEFLVRRGKIKQDDLNQASNTLVKTGNRLGRILVEMQLLSPRELFTMVRIQITDIVTSLFSWKDGLYRMHPDLRPAEERIVLEQTTPALILEGSRLHIKGETAWQEYASPQSFLTMNSDYSLKGLKYSDEEQELLSLVRSPIRVRDILSEKSDRISGEALARLLYSGILVAAEDKSEHLAAETTDVWVWPEELSEQVDSFNKAYRYIIRYLRIEAGPQAAENLPKVFEDVQRDCEPAFQDVQPDRDGTLPVEMLRESVKSLPPAQRIPRLTHALHEYLYALMYQVQLLLTPIYHRQVLNEVRNMLKIE